MNSEAIISNSTPMPKYDWYQSDAMVVISVMEKNVQPQNLTVVISDDKVDLTIKERDNVVSKQLNIKLAHPINTNDSFFKILSTKIEVKLKKVSAIRWNKLEGEDSIADLKTPESSTPSASSIPYYPSSKQQVDWDKVAKEETKDMEEDGDALNNLFRKIYADGTDETRKAMMKSFSESGGTVLSTNWSEVGKDKVDVKPPDGMEYKKYEY